MIRSTRARLAACVIATLTAGVLWNARLPAWPGDPADSAHLFADYPPSEAMVWRSVQEPALAKARAIHLLSTRPGSLEAAEALLATLTIGLDRSRWTTDGLAAVRTAIERYPAAAPALLADSSSRLALLAREYPEPIQAIRDAARGASTTLPREQAAQVAYALLRLESALGGADDARQRGALLAFARDHSGTTAAGLAQVDLIALDARVNRGGRAREIAALEAFAREHDGTCPAAAALRRVARALSHPNGKPGDDPTEGFVRALEIAATLDTPPYKACQPDPATDHEGDASNLAAGLYAYKPAYGPGSIERLLAAYESFVVPRFGPHVNDLRTGLGYVIFGRMAELFEAQGDRAGGLDRFFARLETVTPHVDDARLLRAFIRIPDPWRASPAPASAAAFPNAAAASLRELLSTAREPVAARARATLAWLNQYEGRFETARGLYESYVARYPRSGYAWLAAVRAGQCASEAGDWIGAVALFRSAAQASSSMPFAPAIGHAYAARGFEAMGDATASLAEYRAALAAWDFRFGSYVSVSPPRRPRQTSDVSMARRVDSEALYREKVIQRIAQLARTTAAPGADAVERARWLVDHDRPAEAIPLLGGFKARFPRSANIVESAYLAHKARLFHALSQMADSAGTSRAEGERALEVLSGEPFDFPVGAAAISRAVLLNIRGDTDGASRLMRVTLERWRQAQKVEEPTTDLGRDVASIRRAVFLPLGGAPYGAERWNAFTWPASLPEYLVASADVTLVFADDSREPFSLAQHYPGFDRLLGTNGEQLGILERVMEATGGTAAREGRIFIDKGLMETPVVPVGPSRDAIRFLASFFEARPGHWGGWEFLTYPVVTQIHFTNDARTTAIARVTIGFGGCVVRLEKQHGTWKPVGLTGQWVT
jgi:hypothetical protein